MLIILRIELKYASRGLSAIAELLVYWDMVQRSCFNATNFKA